MKYAVGWLDSGVKPDVRLLGDMVNVLMDRSPPKPELKKELYYMYRGLALSGRDRERMNAFHLRYDITVLNPGTIGSEFVKTAGHYHPHVPGTNLTYTEVYQVLEGEAHYLLQMGSGGRIADAVVVHASAGDVVVIPPNYGHITINPGGRQLAMANWVSSDFKSVYGEIERLHGGAYYETADEGFIPNKNYASDAPLRHVKPADVGEFGLKCGADMYLLVSDLGKLDFLNHPGKYGSVFKKVLNNSEEPR